MNRMLSAGLAVMISCATCYGGTISFEPSYIELQPGEPALVDVTIEQIELEHFDAIWLVFDWPLAGGIEFSGGEIGHRSASESCNSNGCRFQMIVLTFDDQVAPYFVGQMHLPTDGLPPGLYEFSLGDEGDFVSVPGRASVLFDWNIIDPIPGSLTVRVVPEPGCLILLIAGAGVAGVRRRWSQVAAGSARPTPESLVPDP